MGRQRFDRFSWMKDQILAKNRLYEDINDINTYKYYRLALRPWDRKLPPVVEQEANRRQLWQLIPPTAFEIVGVLLLSLFIFQVIAIVPVAANWEHVADVWNDIEKPELVYHDPWLLFACWVVVHLCNGLSLWFVWLGEGFGNHQLAMIPFATMMFLECVWLDILFYTNRLDWVLVNWIFILITNIATQVSLWRGGVEIATIFLSPMIGCCVTVMVYTIEFMKIHGKEWERPV